MFSLRAAARSLQSSAGTKARTPDSTRFLSSDRNSLNTLLSLLGGERKEAATPVPELGAVQVDNQEGKVLDIKLNTVIQELKDMKQLLAQQNKMQRLEFALKNLFAYKMGPIRSASCFIKINSNSMPEEEIGIEELISRVLSDFRAGKASPLMYQVVPGPNQNEGSHFDSEVFQFAGPQNDLVLHSPINGQLPSSVTDPEFLQKVDQEFKATLLDVIQDVTGMKPYLESAQKDEKMGAIIQESSNISKDHSYRIWFSKEEFENAGNCESSSK